MTVKEAQEAGSAFLKKFDDDVRMRPCDDCGSAVTRVLRGRMSPHRE